MDGERYPHLFLMHKGASIFQNLGEIEMAQRWGDGLVGRGLEFDPSVCKTSAQLEFQLWNSRKWGQVGLWSSLTRQLSQIKELQAQWETLYQTLRRRAIEKDT